MKRLFLLLLVLGITMSLFAQSIPRSQFQFAAGNWSWSGNRLVQNDANAHLAKVNMLSLPQNGVMRYQFNMRHEGGLEDGHGGVGIHIFMDTAYNGESWGAGNSYLLWLNYDETPSVAGGAQFGLTGQVYKSTSDSQMNLLFQQSFNEFVPQLVQVGFMNNDVPVNMMVNGDTGEVRLYDPTNPNGDFYFYFYLGDIDRQISLPLRGNNVALRTNGMRVSFGEGF
ncbi:MAG: hypothetical protein FWC21_00820 [Treponema sp.]|nr:hypothetical protein [Treponema sp.]